MAEDIRTLIAGGGVGGDGVVFIVGKDLPYPVNEVKEEFDLAKFMALVDCATCPVVTDLNMEPMVNVDQVLKNENRTLITAFCMGAVRMAHAGRQTELGCHRPKAVKLVFQKK